MDVLRSGRLMALLLLGVAGCSLDVDGSGAGKACTNGRCAAGYYCNFQSRCEPVSMASDGAPAPGSDEASAGGAPGSGGSPTIDVPSSGGIGDGPTNKPQAGATGAGGSSAGGAGSAGAASGAPGTPVPMDAGADPPTPVDAAGGSPPADAACGLLTQYYFDGDGDGFGKSDGSRWYCAPPSAAWVTKAGDCNDDAASVFPGQTKYFTTAYRTQDTDSFDYDCSGREEPDPAAAGPAPNCPALTLLVCGGSGFASTGRTGNGVDSTCGSGTMVTCSGLLACAATSAAAEPKGCR